MGLCIGVSLPEQDDKLGPGPCLEPRAAWEFVQGVEALGYEYVAVGDHVLGAETSTRAGWTGRYDRHVPWHDALVVLAYLAGATQRIRLFTYVVCLPQRPTALVAKQAAEVDVLSGGRLWLGVSAGWNATEFEALGQDFHNRGRRMEEQITVLRALWTQDVVTFNGRWHKLTDVGLSLMPIQRPIPIWIAGGAETVLSRMGRLADGCTFTPWQGVGYRPTGQDFHALEGQGDNSAFLAAVLGRVRGYAREAGRDPAAIQVCMGLGVTRGTPDEWLKQVTEWQSLGVTHVTISTRRTALKTVDEHLKALERFKEEVTPLLGDQTAIGSIPRPP